MGQNRLHCLMRGLPLPPFGSFQYHIIGEGIQREQAEKIAHARLMGSLIGSLGGLTPEKVELIVVDYAEEVLQFKYNYKYKPLRLRIMTEVRQAHSEDMRILDKVAAMTVTEES